MTSGPCLPQRPLKAAIELPDGPRKLGRSLWLYVVMILEAGSHGTVIRTRTRLSEDLSVPEHRVDAWLERLVEAGLVKVVSPAPYLVVRVDSWSSQSRRGSPSGHTGAPSRINRSKAALENGNSNSRTIQQAIGDGGPGEGDLLKRARSILGDLEESELRLILETHSPSRVARVLDRVEKTPPERIRKSRLALFRYLLVRIDDDANVRA